MAIEYAPKEWKDYPDTSTPIMAADLNRIEQAIGTMADNFQTQTAIAQTITQFIINGINALHPEYTISTFSETVETESDKTMTCTVDLNVYNPNKSDGLLITADGVLVSPLAYGVSVDGNTAKIQFFESAGLEIGQSLYATVYHKPENSSGSIAGRATIFADGTANWSAASETTILADGCNSDIIAGIAEEITDEEE